MTAARICRLIGIMFLFFGLLAGAQDGAQLDRDVPADPGLEREIDRIDPAVTTAAVAEPEYAVDTLQLDTASIRGNQELPKVLYIVPWKDPALGDLVGRPVNSLVDEVLAPVDREVFQRQTSYFDQLYSDPDPGPAE